jgi:hypothetical protein
MTRWPKAALFMSGLFFGGAIDHGILAVMASPVTPYGVNVGVRGNWLLTLLDLGATLACFVVYRRAESK